MPTILQDQRQDSNYELHCTCAICQSEKPIHEFMHLIRKGTRRKKRKYCNDCRERFSEDEIGNIMNEIFNPVKEKKFDLEAISKNTSILIGEEILVVEYKYKWRQKESLEYAVRLVEEGAARVIGETAVQLLFDDKSLREHIFKTYNYSCADCGKPASKITRIVPKSEGGLKTPQNLKPICNDCTQAQSEAERQQRLEKKWGQANISYAIPIYLNDSTDIFKVIINPQDTILKFVRDSNSIHCFCDISEYNRQGIFGVALVTTGLNHIRVYVKKTMWRSGRSSSMELNAVHWALKTLRDKNANKIFIYSDTDVLQFNSPITKSLLFPSAKIHYLTHEEKRNPLYHMAHAYSRYARRI